MGAAGAITALSFVHSRVPVSKGKMKASSVRPGRVLVVYSTLTTSANERCAGPVTSCVRYHALTSSGAALCWCRLTRCVSPQRSVGSGSAQRALRPPVCAT